MGPVSRRQAYESQAKRAARIWTVAEREESACLHKVACIRVPLVDLLVGAAAHYDVLLVITGMEPRCEEHLALSKGAKHLWQTGLNKQLHLVRV